MVRVERTGGLTFGVLGFDLGARADTRHAGNPWECHDIRNYDSSKEQEDRHVGRLGDKSSIEKSWRDLKRN